MYFLYVLQSTTTGRFYIGSTGDLANRLAEHNAGENPSTRRERPWIVVHTEAFASRSLAVRREREIKGWKNPSYMKDRLGL